MEAIFTNKEKSLTSKKENDVFDIILFILISLFAAFFTLGRFGGEADFELNQTGIVILGKEILYTPSEPMNLYLFIPGTICYLIIVFAFLVNRYKKVNKLPSKYILSLFAIFVFIRFISIFSFSYGEQSYFFTSPFDQSLINVNYSGFSITNRFISFFTDIFFASYFFIAFDYIKTLSKAFNKALDYFLYAIILLALVMTIYSYCAETSKISNNIIFLFHDHSGGFDITISSFTSYRNVYGFFLLMGCVACFVLSFIRKPNPIYFILPLYFFITDFLVWSRTPLLCMYILFIVQLLFYAIFRFKKNKGYAIFSIAALSAMVVLIIFIFGIFRNSSFSQNLIFDLVHFSNHGTIENRYDLWERALSMFNSPFYCIFGYNRSPFYTIQNNYGLLINSEHIWTSHNSFIDVLLSFGLLGFLFILLAIGYLCYSCIMIIKRTNRIGTGLGFIAIGIVLIVYSCYEPRMLFLMEGTSIFFSIVYLWPVLKESNPTIV